MKIFTKKNPGFTLVEMLFATVILSMAVAGITSVYLMCMIAWQEGSIEIALQNKASSAMEKMVRGVGGRGGIREAKPDITITGSTAIDYYTTDYTSSPPVTVRHKYYLDSTNKRIYYNDYSDTDPAYVIVDNLRSYDATDDPPSFFVSESDGLVTIKIGLESFVRRFKAAKKINVDYSTKVYLRN